MQYIQAFNYDEFKMDSMYEVLKEEFDSIINYKKSLLNCDIKEIENVIQEYI